MPNRETLADGAIRFADQSGSWTACALAPSLVLVTIRADAGEEISRACTNQIDLWIGDRKNVDLFFDALEMTGYATATRVHMTEWFAKRRPQIGSLVALVKSKLVAMGAAVANLAIGGFMDIHTSRPPFAKALEAAKAKHLPGSGVR